MMDRLRRWRSHPLTVWISYLGFLALVLYAFQRQRRALGTFGAEDCLELSLALGLGVVLLGLRGGINVVSFRSYGGGFGLVPGVRLAVLQTVGNYLPLSAGLLAKGVVLRRSFGVPFTKYGAISLYTFAVALAVSGLAGLCALLLRGVGRPYLVTGFALLASAVLAVFVPLEKVIPGARAPAATWGEARRSFRGVLVPLLGLHSVLVLLVAVRLSLSFAVLDHPLHVSSALVLGAGIFLSRLAAVTPGALGVREGIVAGLAQLTGVSPALSILALSVDRLVEVAVMAGGGLLLAATGRAGRSAVSAPGQGPTEAPPWDGEEEAS